MREIKFRYVITGSNNEPITKVYSLDELVDAMNDHIKNKRKIEFRGEYTGLKDKNLCQSDIIEFPFEHPITGKIETHKGVIEKDEYGFIVETLDGSSSFPLRVVKEFIDDIKVIGNTYENPELLK